ncbi:GGDEF domain-containing protein [Vibrio lentus]|nr:GGDEF domain-containing protein [Vibrio lentus]
MLPEKHRNSGRTLYLVGIDRFRDINDSLGITMVITLIIAAARLRGIHQQVLVVARTGGDEFAICTHPM